jgi:transcriptional regulator with XRE-family HTH domain
MTPERLKTARAALGLTQAEFAEAFQVSPRAIGGWEQGVRNGRAHAIPAPVALLVRFALKHADVRLELGILLLSPLSAPRD